MSCEIIASCDGEPCRAEMLDRIGRHVAALEPACGPLAVCRVVVEMRHKHHGFGREVSVSVTIRPEGTPSFFPSSHAVHDSLEAALESAFAAALASARRSVPVSDGAVLPTRSGHIVHLENMGGAGVLKMDDGGKVDFAVTTEEGTRLHIGDKAWLMPAVADHRPQLLVCARRGQVVPVQLAACNG